MKARVLRDKRGKAVASIIDTVGDSSLVPLDVELDDGEAPELKDVEFRTRELFDLDKLHKRYGK